MVAKRAIALSSLPLSHMYKFGLLFIPEGMVVILYVCAALKMASGKCFKMRGPICERFSRISCDSYAAAFVECTATGLWAVEGVYTRKKQG